MTDRDLPEGLPIDFVIYKNKKTSSSSSSHHATDTVKQLLDYTHEMITRVQPQVDKHDLVIRDLNELKIVQNHRDAIKAHAQKIAQKLITGEPPPLRVATCLDGIIPATPRLVTPHLNDAPSASSSVASTPKRRTFFKKGP